MSQQSVQQGISVGIQYGFDYSIVAYCEAATQNTKARYDIKASKKDNLKLCHFAKRPF